MIGTTAVKPRANAQNAATEARQPQGDLDGRYGEIGISAVAAAVHCANIGKCADDAGLASQVEERFIERVTERFERSAERSRGRVAA